MSKGSKSRTTNRRQFRENFDKIEWGKGRKSAEEFRREYLCDNFPGRAFIEDPSCPPNTVFLLSPRDPNESEAQWAKRCAVIKYIGQPEKD